MHGPAIFASTTRLSLCRDIQMCTVARIKTHAESVMRALSATSDESVYMHHAPDNAYNDHMPRNVHVRAVPRKFPCGLIFSFISDFCRISLFTDSHKAVQLTISCQRTASLP